MTSPTPVPIESLIQHRTWLRPLAERLVHDAWDADDVVQETWLAALKSPPERAGSERGWLSRVLRNKATDRLRARRSRAVHEDAAPSRAPAPSVEQVVADAELHRLVAELVTELDEPYRATVLLRFFEGLPPREVARRLDVPVETVRTRTRRGLERLRDQLDTRHAGDRSVWVAALVPLVHFDEVAVPATAAGTGLVGALAMTAKGKTIAAALVAVALGLGTGWFGRAAADDTPVRETELTEVARELDAERARSAELARAVEARNRRVGELERKLAAADEQAAQLTARVDDLTTALAAADGRAAAVEDAAADGKAPVGFEDHAALLDGIDWEGVGKATNDLLPLIVELRKAFVEGRELSMDEMSQIQNANAPLMGAAMTIAGKLPGVGANGPYASPEFMSNLMTATLAAGGHPLGAEQQRALRDLARKQAARDAERARGWNEQTLELRKLHDEIRDRGAFYDESLALMTEAQRALLRPESVRDTVQMDIFGASIQWSMFLRPVRHNGTREHLGKKMAKDFESTVKPPEETHDDLERIIREWVEGLPDALLEVRQTVLDRRGYMDAGHVELSAHHVLELYERIAREVRLGDEALGRLRAQPGPPVPLRYPD